MPDGQLGSAETVLVCPVLARRICPTVERTMAKQSVPTPTANDETALGQAPAIPGPRAADAARPPGSPGSSGSVGTRGRWRLLKPVTLVVLLFCLAVTAAVTFVLQRVADDQE